MNTELPTTDSSDTSFSNLERAELPATEPDDAEPDDASDLDASDLDDDTPYDDVPCTDGDDDARWEAFIPDEDEYDPLPDPGDFWVEGNQDMESGKQGDKQSDLLIDCLLGSPSPTLLA